MKAGDQYLKIVEWSEEDRCYVGTCPGLMLGGIHGDDEPKVYKELSQAVEEWIDIHEQDGRPLPEATAGREYSGKFVVRVGRDLHKALAIGAMRHGESLNEHCVRLLREGMAPYGENEAPTVRRTSGRQRKRQSLTAQGIYSAGRGKGRMERRTGMELEAVIKARRSVRRYSDRPVPREVVDRCIEAARLAPSACNSQPWHFIVVDDPESRALLAEAAFTGAYAMNGFAKSAPVLVVVVTLPSKVAARVGGLLRGVRYNLVDIGIAGEHFALQAAAEGLGTCWLGWFSAAGVKKALGLPRRARIDVVFSLGYAADEPPALPSARKPLEEVREYRAIQR